MTKKLTEFDGEDLGEYPFPGYAAQQELFAQVGYLLTLWAGIEDDLAMLLHSVTGVSEVVAFAILGATEDFTTKIAILDAAAKHSLDASSPHLAEWVNIKNRLRKHEVQKRNAIAHGMFRGAYPAATIEEALHAISKTAIGPTASRSVVKTIGNTYGIDDLREIGSDWSGLNGRLYDLAIALRKDAETKG